jgi:hypothetical protein
MLPPVRLPASPCATKALATARDETRWCASQVLRAYVAGATQPIELERCSASTPEAGSRAQAATARYDRRWIGPAKTCGALRQDLA